MSYISADRLARARNLRTQGLTFTAIGKKLGVSKDAARSMVRRAGAPPAEKATWSREEIDTLRAMRNDGATIPEIAAKLGRTLEAVKSKARGRMYVPSHISDRSGSGWPSVGFDLQANDDKYVQMLLAAARLEGCHA